MCIYNVICIYTFTDSFEDSSWGLVDKEKVSLNLPADEARLIGELPGSTFKQLIMPWLAAWALPWGIQDDQTDMEKKEHIWKGLELSTKHIKTIPVVLAFWTWCHNRNANRLRPRRPRRPWRPRHSGYNFSKRMQPQQGQPLRPLLDADDDLWLDAARQLYPRPFEGPGREDNCSVHPGSYHLLSNSPTTALTFVSFCFSFLILLWF